MKNFLQLSLLVLTVGQSLAADISPPLLVRSSLMMGQISGLGRRQPIITCPVATFDCGGSNGCCPIGSKCLGNARCSGGCGAGSTKCYDSCCEAGYVCQGQNQPCLKTEINTILIPVPGGVSTTSQAPIPGTTPVSSYSTTIPTPPKVVTSETTLVNTYTTTPIKSTSSIVYPVPTPPTTPGGYSNNTGSSSGNSSIPVIPISGTNSLKPGVWLGALGVVSFFAFFHM